MKASKKIIKSLAAHWVKDERTIRRWLKENHPMLEHPDSVRILNDLKSSKNAIAL